MRDLVLRQKPNLRLFTPGGAENLLLVDDVDVGFCWSGDIFPVIEESPEIGYAVPEEGAPLWVHTMCVPARAPRPGNAHLFMNFVLDPQASAQIVQTTRYATANESARKLVPAALRDNPAVYAPLHLLPRCETFSDLEDAQKLYEEAWTEIARG
jgi:spermidine/putrescine transport system substrate-binding protein